MKSFYKIASCIVLLNVMLSYCLAIPKDDTLAIKALFYKAMDYQDYDNDSSWLFAEEGFRLSKKANYKAGIGMAFMRFGALMNAKGNTDSALMYFRNALRIRKELKDYSGIGALCKQMAYVYRNLGRKDSSFYYMYEAQRYYDKTKDSVNIASVYVELANLNTTYQNYNASYTYLQKALPIFIKVNNDELLYQTYIEYGNLYFKQSKNTNALYYYIKADEVNTRLENPVYAASNDNYIGLCYDELEKDEEAIVYFKKSIRAYQSLSMPNEIALVNFNLGNLYIANNKSDSGIHYILISKRIAEEINDIYRLSRCLEILSDAYVQKGDYIKAYRYFVEHSNLADSILNLEKVKQIAEMNVLYETEKREQQIQLLDAQNKIKSTRNKLLITGSTLLLISIIVLVYFYIQRGKLARKKEEVAQQKIKALINEQEIKNYNAMIEGQEEERNRIASDLHDRLGSMLSTVKLLFSTLDSKIDLAIEDHKQQYNKANHLLDEACVEVRRISHNLSTGMVSNFGLLAALEELSDSINESRIIECKLLLYGLDERLNNTLEISIYRMIQEIVNNILKHANAKNITIQLNRVEDSINITVEDNGLGYNVEEKKKSGGMGLANIEARAQKLGGTYHVDSTLGRGSISIIEIPLNAAKV